MLRVSPSNTIDVTTSGPRWQPASAPESDTATRINAEQARLDVRANDFRDSQQHRGILERLQTVAG